tara:strand:+ start:1686 stop:3239 length:1554 start_codon:yes stop_codon:yes gene_type:complete
MSKVIAAYGGGFKPPTSGHFKVVEKALQDYPEIDEFIIFVGAKVRDGVDQVESTLVWDIYKNYLSNKVKIQPVNSPIGDIIRLAKSNPQDTIYFVIGYREGRQDDLEDVSSRTGNLEEKYSNIKIKPISTNNPNVSGTNARKALDQSEEEFIKFLPSQVKEKSEIFNILRPPTSERLNENATYSNSIDIIEKIKTLTDYMITKGYNIEPLPTIEFIDGDSENASNFLGKTAYYDPDSKTIALYTEGRHPKDITRSYAHEMIHHIQNLEGRLGDIKTTNTLEDDSLNKIEAEANLKGTMTFRNWTDSLNEDEDPCWDDYKIGSPKTKISSKTGKRVNNCVPKNESKDYFGLNKLIKEIVGEPKYKIYSDMDGVLTDFDASFLKASGGIPPREYENKFGKEKFWELIDGNGVGYWVGMPYMSDAKQYLNYIKDYNIELLSSPSRSSTSRLGKRLWARNNMPGVKLTLAQASKKQDYASPNSILIDDRKSNIDQWIAAGGIGILHTSAADTIQQLKKLGL